MQQALIVTRLEIRGIVEVAELPLTLPSPLPSRAYTETHLAPQVCCGRRGGMEICGQYFSTEVLDRIRETVESEPRISRRELSRRVCTWHDWRSVNGALYEVSCRKALAELDRQAVMSLPEFRLW